eukprot:Rhum_TRINITY_DN11951_c1_g1::Rhum_TRINITY_DN11951_c1_g1_i1::g.48193::m.48193
MQACRGGVRLARKGGGGRRALPVDGAVQRRRLAVERRRLQRAVLRCAEQEAVDVRGVRVAGMQPLFRFELQVVLRRCRSGCRCCGRRRRRVRKCRRLLPLLLRRRVDPERDEEARDDLQLVEDDVDSGRLEVQADGVEAEVAQALLRVRLLQVLEGRRVDVEPVAQAGLRQHQLVLRVGRVQRSVERVCGEVETLAEGPVHPLHSLAPEEHALAAEPLLGGGEEPLGVRRRLDRTHAHDGHEGTADELLQQLVHGFVPLRLLVDRRGLRRTLLGLRVLAQGLRGCLARRQLAAPPPLALQHGRLHGREAELAEGRQERVVACTAQVLGPCALRRQPLHEKLVHLAHLRRRRRGRRPTVGRSSRCRRFGRRRRRRRCGRCWRRCACDKGLGRRCGGDAFGVGVGVGLRVGRRQRPLEVRCVQRGDGVGVEVGKGAAAAAAVLRRRRRRRIVRRRRRRRLLLDSGV